MKEAPGGHPERPAAAGATGLASGGLHHTPEEDRNLGTVKEYMEIAYDPKCASAAAVRHLVADKSEFIAPSTFPEVKDCLQYAEDHGALMKSVADLRLTGYDVAFAKDSWVCLRYSAQGSHCGEPHGGIAPTHKRACWTAAAIFQLDSDGKILKFYKDWDKLTMWRQLGWLKGEPPALD